jgi:hypothetical protein
LSKLLHETDEYLKITATIHYEPDQYSEWELDKDGSQAYPQKIHEAEHYALYEIHVIYFINKETGKVTYDSFS